MKVNQFNSLSFHGWLSDSDYFTFRKTKQKELRSPRERETDFRSRPKVEFLSKWEANFCAFWSRAESDGRSEMLELRSMHSYAIIPLAFFSWLKGKRASLMQIVFPCARWKSEEPTRSHSVMINHQSGRCEHVNATSSLGAWSSWKAPRLMIISWAPARASPTISLASYFLYSIKPWSFNELLSGKFASEECMSATWSSEQYIRRTLTGHFLWLARQDCSVLLWSST